jgi:Methylase involved in ubiquinone/menaquinone biosynthesis
MSLNEDKVLEYYDEYDEDGRAASSRGHNFEFEYTEKILEKYITADCKVLEVGCGAGYYGLRFAGRCGSYVGVDLVPKNVAVFEEKIAEKQLSNVKALVGDATDLRQFADGSFDVVLCLGPMYHLPEDERQKVFSECLRVLKPEGIAAFAYINRLGVYAGACVNDDLRGEYPNAATNRAVFEQNTDDKKPGVFYFTSPEEMEADAEKHGFSVAENRGLDFFFMFSAVNGMSGEQLECYAELADRMSESRSCVGLSNHALLICAR